LQRVLCALPLSADYQPRPIGFRRSSRAEERDSRL
jgi:hypothetical protein